MSNKKKYILFIYGCQMNKHDGEKATYLLKEMGYEKTLELKEAQLILLLTCSVREKAESKVFGKLGELKALKNKNPDLLIGIGGCMTQQQDMAKKIRSTYPHVDLIFGTHNLHHLKELLEEAIHSKKPLIKIQDQEEGIVSLPFERERDYAAWVSIIYGCNNFCSYCIVPYVRGEERSRPSQEILQEVKNLIRKGVKEITLLGQNVNSYGKDQLGEMDFASLLQALDSLPGLARIRFTTSHPRDFHPSIIKTISTAKKICEHIHLPLQSGSTRILNRMNRGYSKEEYLDLAYRIKETIKGVALTTDIIVGFPGEEEEDFLDTLELLERIRFSSIFSFLYSPRKNTPAAHMKDKTPKEVKRERFQRLLKLQYQIILEENQKILGEVVEILGEGNSKKDPKVQTGRTRKNQVVNFPFEENLAGELIKVRIDEVAPWHLFGTFMAFTNR